MITEQVYFKTAGSNAKRQVETHIVHGKSLPKPLDFTLCS